MSLGLGICFWKDKYRTAAAALYRLRTWVVSIAILSVEIVGPLISFNICRKTVFVS